MSGKNRVTVKTGPAARKKKSNRKQLPRELVETLKLGRMGKGGRRILGSGGQ